MAAATTRAARGHPARRSALPLTDDELQERSIVTVRWASSGLMTLIAALIWFADWRRWEMLEF